MPGDKKFEIVSISKEDQEEGVVNIGDWNPSKSSYDDISEIIAEIREKVSQNFANEISTKPIDIVKGNKTYRFFNRYLGGVGVIVFEESDGKYIPGKMIEYLSMYPDKTELEGVEAVAKYYSNNLQLID